mgnify:CR=1 FL=1
MIFFIIIINNIKNIKYGPVLLLLLLLLLLLRPLALPAPFPPPAASEEGLNIYLYKIVL